MDVLLYIVLGLIILYFVLRRDSGKHKSIPGPTGWPLVGYAPYMKKGEDYKMFTDMAEKYGDIFQLNVIGQSIISLNSAQLITKAFSGDEYKKFMNDRYPLFIGKYVMFDSQNVTFNPKAFGPEHGKLRKAFAQALNVYGEGKQVFEDNVTSELLNLLDIIKGYQGKEFDMLALIRRSLTNVVSIILSGHGFKDDEDVNMFWNFDELSDFFVDPGVNLLMMAFPFLRFIPGVYKTEFDKIEAAKQNLLRRFFYEKKATFIPGEIRGFVDFFIGEQLEEQNEGRDVFFTDERIMSLTLETIGAVKLANIKDKEIKADDICFKVVDVTAVKGFRIGVGDLELGLFTSLSSISSLLLCLLNYPEYQVKIQAELDRVVGRERLPSFSDRRDCVFTEAVILETVRYLAPVPLVFPHYCEEGIVFEGYQIPPKSLVIQNVWYIHHDEKVWGDPWTFRPERWLDDNGDLLPNDHILRQNWLTFGKGRRQCPGESLARSRVFLYVATLLQKWTFEMPPENTVSCDPRYGGNFDIGLLIKPKPFYCRAVPRK